MNISLLNIMHTKLWDFRHDMAQGYADALKNAIELHVPNDVEKEQGFFLSKKGFQKDGKTVAANFEEKLYVDDINRIENHLYWNDEQLAEDDQIINVVYIDGPVTRDGDICSYGTKDFRNQVRYANTIPQVVGHIFMINTPGGQASCRNDYETMIADCREKGKPTVAFVDGMCCSSGVNLACRCDRVVVMSGKDEFGCIGTMAAFWAVAHDTVDKDGYRYVELVGSDCPEKNDWYREAAKGEYEKLQAELDKDTRAFHDEVRQNRPLVTDDMLTGRVFEAQEVIPALVDEIGDMNRAIECVFELADETMTAARFMTAEPKEQQPAGAAGNEPEESTHQINNDMTEKEMKAQEAQGAQAAEQQAEEQQAQEQEAQGAGEAQEQQSEEGAQQEQQSEEGAQEGASEEGASEEGASEEGAAGEGASQENDPEEGQSGEGAQEEGAAGEGQQSEEEHQGNSAAAGEGSTDTTTEAPVSHEQAPASQENIGNTEQDIDKITETLHNAEQMIADRDKEIATLKEALATLNGIAGERDAAVKERDEKTEAFDLLTGTFNKQTADIEGLNAQVAEKDALIEKLQKQVADLKAEVKELAGKPAPMTDGQSGIPADNGTGDAPEATGAVKSIVSADMSPEEIRKALREQDAKAKARRMRR